MRIVGTLALSFFLVAGTFACNRDEPAPPNEKAATASSQKEASSHDSSPDKSPLWIAVFGQLGKKRILVPLTMYSGGTWSHPWPKPRVKNAEENRMNPFPMVANTRALVDLPLAWLGGIPPPATWYGFSSKDGRAVTVHTARGQEIWTDYEYRWILEIDQLTPDIDLEFFSRSENLALNINPQTAELAVHRLGSTKDKSPDWDQVHAFLKPIFDQVEEDAGKYRDQRYTPHDSLQERGKYPLRLSTYKIPVGQDRHLHYFQMEREYPRTEIETIPLVTQLSGWLIHDGNNKFSFINKHLVFDDADHQQTVNVSPQWMIQWDRRTFLYLMKYGWESSGAAIVEWDGSHLVESFSEGLYSK